LNTIFDRLNNIDETEIDIVIDGGLSNIASYIDAVSGDGEVVYDPSINVAEWSLASRDDTLTWRSITSQLINFSQNTRKDCMTIIDGLRPLVIEGNQKIVRTYNYSPHSSLGGYSPADVMSNDDALINEYILLINLYKAEMNDTATDLKIGDSVRIKISDGFQKGTDPRYGAKVHIVKEIYGKNAILDNDKKYIRSQLLKVPADSVSEEKPNIVQKAKTEKKVKTFLKSNDHTSKPLPGKLIRRSLPRKAKNK
jgi:hypothetical protein